MSDFTPLDAGSLASKLSFADEAAALQSQRARRQWDAAYGPRPANGIKDAVLSSDAETGWVFCARHGHMPSVKENGERDYTGVCQACWREDFHPDSLLRRQQEVAAEQARIEAEVASRAALLEADSHGPVDGPGPEVAVKEVGTQPTAVDAPAGPVAGGLEAGPTGPGSGPAFHVEHAVPGVGPRDDARPDRSAVTPDWAWLAGVEDDGR